MAFSVPALTLPQLFSLRMGLGAFTQAPPPHPQLKRISLAFPRTPDAAVEDQLKPVIKGAHIFEKRVLPRFKYHNPEVEVEIKHFPSVPSLLTLHFEGDDPEALRNLAKQGIHSKKVTSSRTDTSPNPSYTDSSAPRPSANDDAVTLKAPPTDPSAIQTVNPPKPIYQRACTFPLRLKSALQITQWLRFRTNNNTYKHRKELYNRGTAQDRRERRELFLKAEKSEVDRARMAVIQAGRDREKAALEQVRKAAEQNAAEAAAAAGG